VVGGGDFILQTLRCLRPKFFQEGDGCRKRVSELAAVIRQMLAAACQRQRWWHRIGHLAETANTRLSQIEPQGSYRPAGATTE
jgi:hypothetical protein